MHVLYIQIIQKQRYMHLVQTSSLNTSYQQIQQIIVNYVSGKGDFLSPPFLWKCLEACA